MFCVAIRRACARFTTSRTVPVPELEHKYRNTATLKSGTSTASLRTWSTTASCRNKDERTRQLNLRDTSVPEHRGCSTGAVPEQVLPPQQRPIERARPATARHDRIESAR